MRNMPKSNVLVVAFAVLSLLTVLLHYVQLQNHEGVKRYLKNAILNNLGPRNGGSKYTLDLFEVISARYQNEYCGDKGGKGAKGRHHHREHQKVGKSKMMHDPLFETLVNKIVEDEVVIEGSNRKPTWKDLLLVRLVMWPMEWAQALMGNKSATGGGDDADDRNAEMPKFDKDYYTSKTD